MKSLKRIYKKQLFQPSALGIFTNPFYFARKGLYQHVQQLSPYISGKTLDVGCGQKPYRSIFKNATEYIGMDIEQSGHDHSNEDIDVFYDGKTFPFGNETFDSIVCNEVLEHVFNPSEFLSEMHRVLKKGGKVLLTVPFVWDEHEQPYDYARYSSFGLKYLVESNGFTVLDQRKSVCGVKVVVQMFNTILFKKWLPVSSPFLSGLLKSLIATPNNLIGLFFGLFSSKKSDLYLDNIIVLEK